MLSLPLPQTEITCPMRSPSSPGRVADRTLAGLRLGYITSAALESLTYLIEPKPHLKLAHAFLPYPSTSSLRPERI